ncbi:prenylated flavin chaperone LpdD [Thermoactinomyces mirandus]|uniref:Prenylated flavin chaperone LpdD-like domain-containing protein n=1 Tax=Thermoactinomyces mirandus TaxID=2756294 RepID=A0A7W1XQG3_9BACL|nr:hypothetical protein [Thermoactinomyces mirandus]MBA4601378.1 hypothetical protein [Thermoactinomyces mirandus]
MKEYHIIIGQKSRDRIELKAFACGMDYSVIICGGTHYHIGSTALGHANTGKDKLPGNKATVSVICAPGHRDDEVARWAARYLATELKCNVSVSVGIHIDNASQEEINALITNCKKVCKKLVQDVFGEWKTKAHSNNQRKFE